jgi:hypothetical protein
MAIKYRTKRLVIKIETTYGTDAVPTGALNGFQAKDIEITPMDGEDVSRDLDLPYIGAEGTIPAGLYSRIKFKVEMEPSGVAGTAPAWGPALRACGVAQVIAPGVSVTYNPIPVNEESATIYFGYGGTLHKIPGARGNVKFMIDAQGIPYLEFDFMGLFLQPAEAAIDPPALGNFKKPRVGSKANTPVFTVNGVSLVMRSFSLDLGNQVEPRLLIGSEEIIITQREDTVEMTVDAVPLTTLNPYLLAGNTTDVPVALTHGVGAGRIAALAIPTMQLMRPTGITENQGIVEWPLKGMALGTNGTDQWSLTLT